MFGHEQTMASPAHAAASSSLTVVRRPPRGDVSPANFAGCSLHHRRKVGSVAFDLLEECQRLDAARDIEGAAGLVRRRR